MTGFKISIVIATGAAALLLAACVTAAALIAPQTAFAQAVASVFPLAEPHAAAAEAALGANDLVKAEGQTWAELRVSPVRESAWVRLARIDFARHRAITPNGAAALSHSFDAAPYDLAPQSERAAFMRAHYAHLPLALQMMGADEARVRADQPSVPVRGTGL